MIAHVRGPVAAVTITSAVIDVGGVGMQVMCTPGTIATLRIGTEVQLSTSMVVREDSLTIFGFATNDERDMFEPSRRPAASVPRSPRRCSRCSTPTGCVRRSARAIWPR
ncbi:Holliday junction ATP-dependent DNA helicase RuvA [Aeromicrobium sp. UC242_57]|uniref:Holliday junction ATP-dependent DNA helicase RuvA n=1 Tax=Aeromicrobium sp. UC242_57 TaxID=3374624 RepID=UPI0037B5E327